MDLQELDFGPSYGLRFQMILPVVPLSKTLHRSCRLIVLADSPNTSCMDFFSYGIRSRQTGENICSLFQWVYLKAVIQFEQISVRIRQFTVMSFTCP